MQKPLANARKSDLCKIIQFKDTQSKTETMRYGLAVGETVKCLANVGPIIVGKNLITIAVGRNLAKKIYVECE